MDYSPSGSSVLWILQARILEWIAILFSRESSQPRNQTLHLLWLLYYRQIYCCIAVLLRRWES